MSTELDRLIAEAKKHVDAMTPDQLAAMKNEQAASWVRAEMSWPEPKFEIVDGVKVYASYEDYCND